MSGCTWLGGIETEDKPTLHSPVKDRPYRHGPGVLRCVLELAVLAAVGAALWFVLGHNIFVARG